MTSPVDTSVKFFHNFMTGAPQIAGVAGSMIALLDACLVNGWGAKAVTSIIVSGRVATVSFSGDFGGPVESVILVAGVTGSMTGLNGEQKISGVGTNSLTFATAEADGTAAGTITIKMAPLGFAKAFTGTNLAAYRSGVVGSNRLFLRVADASAVDARVNGYETMSAISTGTNLFPTAAQFNGGMYWPKSDTANATANQWFIVGNGKIFYVGVAVSHGSGGGGVSTQVDSHYLFSFGEFSSWKSTADGWNSFLTGSNQSMFWFGESLINNYDAGGASRFMARGRTAAAGSKVLSLNGNSVTQGSSGNMQQGPGPSPITGGILLSGNIVFDGAEGMQASGPRGSLPGIWHCTQTVANNTFLKYDVLPGAGETIGRKLLALPTGTSSGTSMNTGANCNATFIDVTGPWA